VGAGAAVLVAGVGTAAALGFGGDPKPAPARSSLPPATAEVTRTTLTQTETVSGILGYGDAVAVTARASGAAAAGGASGGGTGGTVTWLPAVGAIVTRGKPVYKVDDRPVVLIYGSTPMYRGLVPGDDGADVKQLEQNLSALGYGGFTVDSEYTSATVDAVERWQEDLGLDETGTVDLSQVLVAPGQIRIAEHKLAAGDTASGAVLAWTGTTRLVTVNLDVNKQHLVKTGIAATIELPDGTTVAGTVTSVGTVATTSTTGSGNQAQSSTTIDVTVSAADQEALGTLDSAPVDVVLQADKREDVLTVPVNALVALREGGYGVQVVEATGTRYVAVKTGMFAAGRVEVTGDGIAEGTVVGVPA
jgi:hypothetical protein